MVDDNTLITQTSDIDDDQSPSRGGSLLVGITVLSVISLIVFVYTGLFGICFGLTGWLVYFDARCSGIYKRQETTGILRMNPLGWGVFIHILFVIFYPLYILNRNSLKTKAGSRTLWIFVNIMGLITFALVILGVYGWILGSAYRGV